MSKKTEREVLPPEQPIPEIENHDLKALLQKIFVDRGTDFREYKRTSLRRRIQKRLEALGLTSYREYADILDKDPGEYNKLFDALLINVTSFFRDPEGWEALKKTIPKIIGSKKKGDPIRVWSAGCASGEEPYSIAILFAEELGEEIRDYDFRIYATDIDERALTEARHATYVEDKLKDVKSDYRLRYFTREEDRWRVNRNIRQMIVFGVQNLTTDAPISHLDLIVCRNVLIYFNVELQNRLLRRFHYALNPAGYMYFGKSESMLVGSRLFKPVDKKWRLFQKISEIAAGPTIAEGRRATHEEALVERALRETRGEIRAIDFYFRTIVQNINLGILVVNNDRIITSLNQAWEKLWATKAKKLIDQKISQTGLMEMSHGLDRWLDDAFRDGRTVTVEGVETTDFDGEKKVLDFTVVPLIEHNGTVRGAIIIANDVTETKKLINDLKRSNEELQALNEKLETTNEELVSSNEELETTTEELQSTTEELETNNEELQSTNEELETTNEELMSTNEELETTNDELRAKTDLLNSAVLYNQLIMHHLAEGFLQLDIKGKITSINDAAASMWNVNRDDIIGRKVSALNPELEKLVRNARAVLKKRPKGEAYNYQQNFKFTTYTGETRFIDLTIAPAIDMDGEDLGTLVIMKRTDSFIKTAKSSPN